MRRRGTLCNPNQLISRLAKHQSIRTLEGLEARLPHLFRGRHKEQGKISWREFSEKTENPVSRRGPVVLLIVRNFRAF